MEMQGIEKLRDVLTTAETVLDVGAREGQHTLFCSRSNPHSNIYSFEPETRFFVLLEKNVRKEGANNVTILQNAVGSKKRVAQVGPEEESEDVDMVTVDSLGLVGCDYIRVGPAGAPPRAVLLGAANTLRRFFPVVLFDKGADGALGAHGLLSDLGYDFSDVGDSTLAVRSATSFGP